MRLRGAQLDPAAAIVQGSQQSWRLIERVLFPDRPVTPTAMLPVWTIDALYDRADGVIEAPAAYERPGGALDNFTAATLAKQRGCSWQQVPADAVRDLRDAVRRRWYYFGPRHLDPRFHVEVLPAGPDRPRPLSQSLHDLRRDWDFVITRRDQILQDAGLSPGHEPWAVAERIAHHLYAHCRGGGPRRHPVDVLAHRGYCLGAANAAIAMLESLDIPVRCVSVAEHALAEVWLRGGWRLIESSPHFIDHPPGSRWLLPVDMHQISTDPGTVVADIAISDYHRAIFHHFGPAYMHARDGRWTSEVIEGFAPRNAIAFYGPSRDYRFKTLDPHRLTLLNRGFRIPQRLEELMLDLLPGEALRESLWLGDLADLRGVQWHVRLGPWQGRYPQAADLATLSVGVNEASWPATTLLGCGPTPFWDQTQVYTLDLPMSALRPGANTLLLSWSGSLPLRVPIYPAVLEPCLPPWRPR